MKDDAIDFLGIGAQKTASSWLWTLLKQHNDIWMPPRKELHYFDRDLSYPSPSFLHSDLFETRLNGSGEHNVLFRKKMISEIPPSIVDNIQDMQWKIKYFFSNYSDEWYRSLFEQGKGKLRGEITPSYSILNENDIERIKKLFPSLKKVNEISNREYYINQKEEDDKEIR